MTPNVVLMTPFKKKSEYVLLISKVWVERRKKGHTETRVWGPGVSQAEFKAALPPSSFVTWGKLLNVSVSPSVILG